MGIFDFLKSKPDDGATDPVCQMKVSKSSARFSFDYEGKTYYFCSGGCLETFKTDPKKYAGK